jgi:cytochrome c-type biogenesis protein CcmH/NrfF
LVLLIGGAIVLIVLAGQRKRAHESAVLSDDEQARLARLLAQDPRTDG